MKNCIYACLVAATVSATLVQAEEISTSSHKQDLDAITLATTSQHPVASKEQAGAGIAEHQVGTQSGDAEGARSAMCKKMKAMRAAFKPK